MGNYQQKFKTRLGSTVKTTETFVFPEINDSGHFLLSSLQKAGFSIEFRDLTLFLRHGLEITSNYYQFNFKHSSLIWEDNELTFYFNWIHKPSYADEIIPVNSETLDYILGLFNCNLVKREYKVKYTFYEKLEPKYSHKWKMKPYGAIKGRNEYSYDDKYLIPVVIKTRARRELKVNPADYYELDEQFSTLDNYH